MVADDLDAADDGIDDLLRTAHEAVEAHGKRFSSWVEQAEIASHALSNINANGVPFGRLNASPGGLPSTLVVVGIWWVTGQS